MWWLEENKSATFLERRSGNESAVNGCQHKKGKSNTCHLHSRQYKSKNIRQKDQVELLEMQSRTLRSVNLRNAKYNFKNFNLKTWNFWTQELIVTFRNFRNAKQEMKSIVWHKKKSVSIMKLESAQEVRFNSFTCVVGDFAWVLHKPKVDPAHWPRLQGT